MIEKRKFNRNDIWILKGYTGSRPEKKEGGVFLEARGGDGERSQAPARKSNLRVDKLERSRE